MKRIFVARRVDLLESDTPEPLDKAQLEAFQPLFPGNSIWVQPKRVQGEHTVGYDYTFAAGEGNLRFKAASLQKTIAARVSSISSCVRELTEILGQLDSDLGELTGEGGAV